VRVYLDSSAIVKLVQREVHSDALAGALRAHGNDERVTSMLARVEVVRAVLPAGDAAVSHARRQLARIHQIAVDLEILDRAATMAPLVLRSLDAVHLASAQLLGGDLRSLVTYDHRMAEAAASSGLPVLTPV